MPLQTSTSAADAFQQIRAFAGTAKAAATNAIATLQGGSNSEFIFRTIDALTSFINVMNAQSGISGLNAYATSVGYSGTLTADISAAITAAQSCISWITANFPQSGGYILAETLNPDGSRTPRNFTNTQTAGLQTALNNFIATIS